MESRENGSYSYDVYREYVVLTGYLGEDTAVTVPSQLDGLPVRRIAGLAFYEGVAVESVVLPDTVTELEDNAFYYCTAMSSVTLPDSITKLGNKCFSWCSALEEITLPAQITEIPSYCFNQCVSLKTLHLPAGITSVGIRAFSGCASLESLLLGETVTSVGNYAFLNCTLLKVLSLPGTCTLGQDVFTGCSEELTVVTAEGSPCWKACESLDIRLSPDLSGITLLPDVSGEDVPEVSAADSSDGE